MPVTFFVVKGQNYVAEAAFPSLQKNNFQKFSESLAKTDIADVLCGIGNYFRHENGGNIMRVSCDEDSCWQESVSRKFEVYCKKLIANDYKDYSRAVKRRAKHEVLYADLTDAEMAKLWIADRYTAEYTVFDAAGEDRIPIADDRLAAALLNLTARKRDIVLLAVCCGESDDKIAGRLFLKRSTVQYQKSSTLKYLRERMGKR
jgi:hypothetical protein